jgi:hypothetical protein
MDIKCKLYVNMVKLINDLYKDNDRDYRKSLELIKIYNNEKDDLLNEMITILKYVQKLYISYDKKIDEIKEDLIIKTGINISHNHLIDIYKEVYRDNRIDIEIMLLIIIPSITIKLKNGIEIIDMNIGSYFNNTILKIVEEDEGCSICYENFKKTYIISNCCCYKTCLRCFNLLNGKCAICKEENPIIINKK